MVSMGFVVPSSLEQLPASLVLTDSHLQPSPRSDSTDLDGSNGTQKPWVRFRIPNTDPPKKTHKKKWNIPSMENGQLSILWRLLQMNFTFSGGYIYLRLVDFLWFM